MAWLSRRRILVLGLLLGLPSLFLGYFADDVILRHDLIHGGGGLGAALRLYRFSTFWVAEPGQPQGFMPWWTTPGYHTDFLRPLSGVLFWLDERLWPGGGALAHLHSLLWWGLVLLGCSALLRRWLPPRLALLALFLVAVDDGHWMPMAWLANRHALVAPALVFAGILAHLRWRDDGWRAGLPLSLGAFAVGLSAGESALQALAYLYSDELAGSGRRSGRLARLAPVTALIVIYGVLRGRLGAGVAGSGVYFDPLHSPLRFLSVLPARLAVLLGDLSGGVPSDLWFALPRGGGFLAGFCALVALFVGWLFLRAWRKLPETEARAVRGLAVGAVLSLVPGAAGLPGSRLLLAPSLGSSVVIAVILLHLPSPRWARGWLFVVHVVLAPLALLLDQSVALRTARRTEAAIAASDFSGDVVVLTAPDPFLSIYPSYVEEASGRHRVTSYRVLSFAPLDLELERTGPRDLRLTARGGEFFASPIEHLLRDTPPQPGDVVSRDGVTVRVESPAALSFHFDAPLEPLSIVAWHDGAFRRLTLPPVGERLSVPREPGMMGW